jgi:hypothetical protein
MISYQIQQSTSVDELRSYIVKASNIFQDITNQLNNKIGIQSFIHDDELGCTIYVNCYNNQIERFECSIYNKSENNIAVYRTTYVDCDQQNYFLYCKPDIIISSSKFLPEVFVNYQEIGYYYPF